MANVPHPLSLFMPVLPGTKMNDILAAQAAASEQARQALVSIGTVHFARFLLLDTSQPNLQPDMRAADVPSNTLIMAVMTEYDGDFDAYIYDFVDQLGDVFNTNLQFVVGGAAVTPVQNNVAGFNAFIKANDASQHSPNTGMFAAYSQSVQQVLAAFS